MIFFLIFTIIAKTAILMNFVVFFISTSKNILETKEQLSLKNNHQSVVSHRLLQ